MTITATDSVTWVNRDTVNHQVVSDTGAFASPTLRPGQRFTFTFRESGQYRYRDALEPAERGTVIVRGLPPALTLAINNPIMTWGVGEMKLSGTVNNGRAGETVAVEALGRASDRLELGRNTAAVGTAAHRRVHRGQGRRPDESRQHDRRRLRGHRAVRRPHPPAPQRPLADARRY